MVDLAFPDAKVIEWICGIKPLFAFIFIFLFYGSTYCNAVIFQHFEN